LADDLARLAAIDMDVRGIRNLKWKLKKMWVMTRAEALVITHIFFEVKLV